MIDFNGMLLELYTQRNRLTTAIAELESLNGTGNSAPPVRSRRGRKSMGDAERREVSARMKRYWAARREVTGAA